MSWAAAHISALQEGKTVSFRPKGSSMSGRIESGQRVTLEPVQHDTDIVIDDIVLCSVRGRHYLHLVESVRKRGGNFTYLIANNRGFINGWTPKSKLYGRVVRIED